MHSDPHSLAQACGQTCVKAAVRHFPKHFRVEKPQGSLGFLHPEMQSGQAHSDARRNRVADLGGRPLGRPTLGHVGVHGCLDAGGVVGAAQVVEQQRHGGDGGGGVSHPETGDVGRRAVHGLEHRRELTGRVDVARGGQADAAGDCAGEVGDDVAEQVVGDDHVEALRVLHEHDHGGIDVQVIDRHLGVLRPDGLEDAVPAELKKLLRGELAARDQYFVHSRYYEDFGLTQLYTRINHEMEEETQHADDILRRILFLEGTPDMRPHAFEYGKTVSEMLRKDLAVEYSVQKNLTEAMALCEKHNDYVSRDMLLSQLRDTEEDHTYWLEKQLRLIEMLGLENYLQSQI